MTDPQEEPEVVHLQLPEASEIMMKVYLSFCTALKVSPNELTPDPVTGAVDPEADRLQKVCEHLAQVAANTIDPEIKRYTNQIEALKRALEPKTRLILPAGAGRSASLGKKD